ncbi:LAME_0H12552g1_1 [Lachancea meyersii CBS 8951]|uniref:LAME_0H12552g1_1 n=1 Tax=Lachancea meyersii CBS 8951 TaxID=1266667 RepID=A0A1G4KH49_9SACH|nr:LAME_0H12552g1_1 [Lachancea meyersii CBS 8951]
MVDPKELESAPLLGNNAGDSRPKTKKNPRRRKRKSAFKGPGSVVASDSSHVALHEPQERPLSSANDFDKTDSWGILHEGTDEETSNTRGSSDVNLASLHHPQSYFDHRPSIAVMEAINSSSSVRKPRRASVSRGNQHGPVSSSAQNVSNVSSKKKSSKSETPLLSPQDAERWAKYASKHYEKPDAHSRGDDVVIDVDALMDHVIRSNNSHSSTKSSSVNPSEEGYHSRPLSRRSSASSSINDVCLPLDDEDVAGTKVWPDVAVLEEYSKAETDRLRSQAVQDAENFHFQYDDEDDEYEDSQNNDGVLFSKPIVTNIDVPELGNTRINEAEHMEAGRLRPKKITPWHLRRKGNNIPGFSGQTDAKNVSLVTKNEQKHQEEYLVGNRVQYPPHIVSNNPEHFRFTYFREDLDSTIHSPTISGLLQPGQKFEELFVASAYSGNSSNGSNSENNNTSNTPGETKNNTPQQQQTPLQRLTTTQSGSLDMYDCEPFWLDVSNPTEEEMKVLSKAFGIHPLTTEDIFLGEVREKVELFKDYYLVCFRSFDIVAERHTRNKKMQQQETSTYNSPDNDHPESSKGWLSKLFRSRRRSSTNKTTSSSSSSYRSKARREIEENEKYKRKSGDRRKPRGGELEPLNVYIIVFRTGVLTFHFAPTPHPINVRRRARLLKDYLNVTADWIAYALIDDITDAFAPMIEIIEDEVHDIEESILNMHQSGDSSEDDEDSSEDESYGRHYSAIERYPRRGSAVGDNATFSTRTRSTRSSSSSSSIDTNIIGWKRKGDMLRRIGECRKRVMSIVRLLGSKADVIKGFSKRCNEQWEVAPRSEIGMYLGDIQDHIVTMVSSLNHYEKLLSRSHSNYLAQINIDMTKVNNDMNDVLGKITILGTVVLPMNIITGLWGMNVLVPGQENHSLTWFTCITTSMLVFAYIAYFYTKKRFGF